MFSKEALIFGSKSKAQEILFLNVNAKEVVRQGFTDEELFKVEKYCQKEGLHLVKSNFKIVFADEGSYSNKGFRIPESDPRPGMHFVYVSHDEEQAHLAAYFEMMNNHKGLGMILGYPSCCIDYFCRKFSAGNANPELVPTNMYTNLSKRSRDMVLISHFPCKSDCEKSIALGKKYLMVLQKEAPERAAELIEKLKV